MDLKKCPFCGSAPSAVENLPPYPKAYGVTCPHEGCLVSPWTRWHRSPEAAAFIWNSRHGEVSNSSVQEQKGRE